MDETTKYFVFNTICSFMFVIPLGRLYKLGSKIENIFVDSLVGGGRDSHENVLGKSKFV